MKQDVVDLCHGAGSRDIDPLLYALICLCLFFNLGSLPLTRA